MLMEDGRMKDARVIGMLLAHLGSGELNRTEGRLQFFSKLEVI